MVEETKVEADATVAEETEVEDTAEDTLLGGKETDETEEESEESTETKKEVTPEKYEYKLPEGMELDTSLAEKVDPLFKEIGLSQEQAQKLVDVYAPYIKEQSEAANKQQLEGYKQTVEGWKAETLKELGTESEAKLAKVSKVIDKFGTPKLREVLNDTGLGNHPELVRAFLKLGEVISEDSFANPSQQKNTSGVRDPKKIYTSMKE